MLNGKVALIGQIYYTKIHIFLQHTVHIEIKKVELSFSNYPTKSDVKKLQALIYHHLQKALIQLK